MGIHLPTLTATPIIGAVDAAVLMDMDVVEVNVTAGVEAGTGAMGMEVACRICQTVVLNERVMGRGTALHTPARSKR